MCCACMHVHHAYVYRPYLVNSEHYHTAYHMIPPFSTPRVCQRERGPYLKQSHKNTLVPRQTVQVENSDRNKRLLLQHHHQTKPKATTTNAQRLLSVLVHTLKYTGKKQCILEYFRQKRNTHFSSHLEHSL